MMRYLLLVLALSCGSTPCDEGCPVCEDLKACRMSRAEDCERLEDMCFECYGTCEPA